MFHLFQSLIGILVNRNAVAIIEGGLYQSFQSLIGILVNRNESSVALADEMEFCFNP
jgi:hypothetical protein